MFGFGLSFMRVAGVLWTLGRIKSFIISISKAKSYLYLKNLTRHKEVLDWPNSLVFFFLILWYVLIYFILLIFLNTFSSIWEEEEGIP